MKKTILILLMILVNTVTAQDDQFVWPREIEKGLFVITLYQPQLETLTGNNLDGRMAISVKRDKGDMMFGALWFTVRLDTDKSSRTAVLESMDVTKIKFPDVQDELKIETLKETIEADIESVEIVMSLDKIIAGLENVEQDKSVADQLNNEAPDIYFRTEPTVLVIIDGEPRLKSDDNSSLEYVLNTAFFIVKKNSTFYLKGENHWYKSDEIVSNTWKSTSSVPKDIRKLAEEKFPKDKKNTEEYSKEPPQLIVVTKGSELIITKDDLAYEPIKGTTMLYVTNTENDIILDIGTQTHYVLLNGRWYSTLSMKDADWKFVDPEKLPEEFASIPAEGTSISSVRVSVPGTEESKEAMYEQYIPQTAKVDRKTASTSVTYDGEPQFDQIEGTDMMYAKNTANTVLLIDNTFYAIDNGVWFESSSANGPWVVSDRRPEGVDEIPPSSPVYNVKYVYIYDSTPDVVYVGYTPGYYHSYMYGGVVVYGTGYYYQPWYGSYYYPRPVTYGFGVHYNPYTGWGFAVGVSYGWMTLSVHSHGYWGPGGYAHGYRHGYHNGYHHGYHNGYSAGYARGRYDASNAYRGGSRSNLEGRSTTSRPGISSRKGDVSQARKNGTIRNDVNNRTAQRPNASKQRNDHYADRNGNVYQRSQTGNWQEKRNNSSQSRPNSNSGQRTQPNRSNQQSKQRLEQQYNNRSRGNTTSRNYSSNRSRTGTTNSGSVRSRRR